MYDVSFVVGILSEHASIVSNGAANRENPMMYLWLMINVSACMDWIESGCLACQ